MDSHRTICAAPLWTSSVPLTSTLSRATIASRIKVRRRWLPGLLLIGHLLHFTSLAQTLTLPPRPATALTASQLLTNVTLLSTNLEAREAFVRAQILSGNVPDFLRQLSPVTVTHYDSGRTNTLTFYATPDYLALGRNDDYLLMPMTPVTAQDIADHAGCILPTRKMADAIFANATVRLAPQPLPPDSRMTTPAVFIQHNDLVRAQRAEELAQHPLGALTVGAKKDVVISTRLASVTNKVAIYGWPRLDGSIIQPLFLGHTAAWVDYSHGVRLVAQAVQLNGQRTNIAAVLAATNLCPLLSDEGVMLSPRYPTPVTGVAAGASPQARWPEGFRVGEAFGELTRELHLPEGVRMVINAPALESFAPNQPVELIIFAVPNGNTIEWTIGKRVQPGDDWRFDIQQIGAQTRWLRQRQTNQTLVVAYLENSLKSWPAWRRQHGDADIPALINVVRDIFAAYPQRLVLTGHSGGGSLTFGYLNALPEIPDDVERIAFLDSNYAYETTNHLAKLSRWLRANSRHHLSVLAYHDSIALLNGKTFVSERGGTWGRSHAMLADLSREFSFTSNTNDAGLQTHLAANGRIQFFLKENPEKKILHTVQVDRNGFIHALLTGTPLENRDYEYFGARVYEQWIQGN